MPMDYHQLLNTLIEETQENLAEVDESLLSLDLSAPDLDIINRIFRAIHTIKGNSAIFKLESIGKLMHIIETFLDEAKKGTITIEKNHVDVLLQVSDGVRIILGEIQNKKPIDENLIANLLRSFQEATLTQVKISETKKNEQPESKTSKNEELQESKRIISSPTENTQTIQQEKSIKHIGWHISIRPKKDIFKKNLDPLRVFQFLREEAEIKKTIVLIDKLPPFESFDALECYLTWELDLIGNIAKNTILEILTWVFDEQDITFAKITQKNAKTTMVEPIQLQNAKESEETSKISSSNQTSPKEATSANEKKSIVSTTLRITTDKIDALMNAVGELVIIESMLKQTIKKMDPKHSLLLEEPFDLLDTNFRYLQDILLRIRMVPIAFAINRFPRMVFEISNKMGKQVEFVVRGDQTEIDKNLIDKITDPLLHLIRNAIDHGIESPEIREKKGKKSVGTILFNAYQEGDSISIEIKDDGAGIDPNKIRELAISRKMIKPEDKLSTDELYQIIFKPGFSTASQVTEYSGRGIGLDVVEKNIRAMGGAVQISSTLGIGSYFKIRLPLTLAIMDCQLIRSENQTFIIPLLSIIEMGQINLEMITFEGNKNYYQFNNNNIPIIILKNIISDQISDQNLNGKSFIIVQSSGRHFALVCDELLIQQPVVIKTLEENFCKVPGIVGATIMGDGNIGLIIDIQEIIEICNQIENNHPPPKIDFFTQVFSLSTNRSTQQLTTNDEATDNYLCFLLGKNEYAINMAQVKEINLLKKSEYLPFTPIYVAGIINLHGRIIPVVDLRLFFNINTLNNSNKGIFIIVNLEKEGIQKMIALIVDAITDTQTINKQEISPIPKAGHLLLSHYIQGLVYINDRIITLLEIQNLVAASSSQG